MKTIIESITINDINYKLPFSIEIDYDENYKPHTTNEALQERYNILEQTLIKILEKYNEGDKNGKI